MRALKCVSSVDERPQVWSWRGKGPEGSCLLPPGDSANLGHSQGIPHREDSVKFTNVPKSRPLDQTRHPAAEGVEGVEGQTCTPPESRTGTSSQPGVASRLFPSA